MQLSSFGPCRACLKIGPRLLLAFGFFGPALSLGVGPFKLEMILYSVKFQQDASGLLAAADALGSTSDEYGNDSRVEALWAMKAIEHAEVYFNVSSVTF